MSAGAFFRSNPHVVDALWKVKDKLFTSDELILSKSDMMKLAYSQMIMKHRTYSYTQQWYVPDSIKTKLEQYHGGIETNDRR